MKSGVNHCALLCQNAYSSTSSLQLNVKPFFARQKLAPQKKS
jgi:hypothetical protein